MRCHAIVYWIRQARLTPYMKEKKQKKQKTKQIESEKEKERKKLSPFPPRGCGSPPAEGMEADAYLRDLVC